MEPTESTPTLSSSPLTTTPPIAPSITPPKAQPDDIEQKKVQEIDLQVQKVQQKMSENLGKILQKGEQIETLQMQAEHIRENSHEWKKAAEQLSWRERLRAFFFFCPCL